MESVERSGVIVAHYGVEVDVLFSNNTVPERIGVKRNSGHVVGDNVIVKENVLFRLDRNSALSRLDARGGVHFVGANIDILCIVVTCEPLPPPHFIDRAIIAARASAITPVLIANKSDLLCFSDYFNSIRATYKDSVEILSVSAHTSEGIESIVELFSKGHRGVFVGTTGVGKSSIVNTILPESKLQVGEICEIKKRGRHTTTVATLHLLENGGELIDSPGFNDFGLVDLTTIGLSHHFPGFEMIQTFPCKFRNCMHRNEPDCAVLARVREGTIPEERYRTYLQLLTEVEALELSPNYRENRNRRKK